MKKRVPKMDAWHRLDNAARVFAALATRRNTTVFRVAATLRTPVDRASLQDAFIAIMPRFPYFSVRLRSGLFWHYLVEIPGAPIVQEEQEAPCRRIRRRRDGPWQFRVLVFDRRIALECSHALTDGSGALAFLCAVLAEYLERRGVTLPPGGPDGPDATIMRRDEPSHPEEWEDAYRRFYDEKIPPPPSGARALRLRGRRMPADACRVVLGIVPLAPLRELSNEHGVTLTELLVSILLASVLDIAGDGGRPIAVMTPVDLRRIFASRTMRNFFLSVTASVDPRLGEYAFEEILHEVHHSMQRQVSVKSISRQIRRNVGTERNAFIRHIPLFLKAQIKRWLYRRRWGARYTTALSNLGRVELPAPLNEHVERIELIPNPSAAHGVGCAVIGYGEELFITFNSIVAGTDIERAFFARLRRMGITARIETN